MMTEVAVKGLKEGPETIELSLPDFDLPFLSRRRYDMADKLKPLAAAVKPPETPAGGFATASVGDLIWDIGSVTDPYQWVGEVEGFEGAQSVVVLVVGEQDDSVHGVVRFVDQKGKLKLYHVSDAKGGKGRGVKLAMIMVRCLLKRPVIMALLQGTLSNDLEGRVPTSWSRMQWGRCC